MATPPSAQAEARERLAELEDVLFDSEAALAAAQSALADRNARRAAAERAIREAEERVARVSREAERVGRDLAALDASLGGDVGARGAGSRDGAGRRIRRRGGGQRRRPPARRTPRPATPATGCAARRRTPTAPRSGSKPRPARWKRCWPPTPASTGRARWTALTAERGFETALGAALGDDLDAAIDAAAPDALGRNRRRARAIPRSRPAARPCPITCRPRPRWPAACARSASWRGTEGARLRASLRPGQRLVSREGDLWRWDGFTTAADAPTPAARRLAERARLADLKGEAEAAREAAESLRHEGERAEAAVRAAAQDETHGASRPCR